MKEHTPGPNDFHFAKDPTTGVLVQKPGLGADEPTEKARLSADKAAADDRARTEALERAAAEVRNEALALEERERQAEQREEQRKAEHNEAMAKIETDRIEIEQMRAEVEAMRAAASQVAPTPPAATDATK